MHQHIRLNRWVVGIGAVVLISLNDHFLVDRGRGIAFEERFRGYSKARKTILYVAAVDIVLASGIALYLSGTAYHRAFNITVRQGW